MNRNQATDRCRDPFEDTLEAIANNEASSRHFTILNDTLRIDPDARRAYVRTMTFEAMLAREFPVLEEPKPAAPPRRSRWLATSAVAAALVLAIPLAWWLRPGHPTPSAAGGDLTEWEGEFTHAVITSLDDASGRFGQTPLAQGQRLAEGTLRLDRGLAEITFDTGAEVTLEGPALLELESEHKARLAAGRASARVPEQARGFVIHTPSSYIRDLGTAFAVEVRDGCETDLHVLEGEVEVAATGRQAKIPPQILGQSKAVRLAAGTISPINFRADDPALRRQTRSAKIPPCVHWPFDSWDGNTTTDVQRGHLLKLQQKTKPATPELIEGPFGQAIHFNGQGTFARSNYPGVSGTQPRTVACWLRLDPTKPSPVHSSNSILAWGLHRSSGKWRIAWNKAQGQGAAGAPRVEFGDGFAIGSSDLRDGRWHHLAVVCLGGPKANVATHVRIYVDGRLEPLTGRRQRRIDTDTTSAAARPLTLGRNLGPDSGPGWDPGFEGDLDEVHVFEGALLPKQIVRLMKLNQLRAAKAEGQAPR